MSAQESSNQNNPPAQNPAHPIHPGPPPRRSRPLRGIPTSRAYWELKAEQMMNRIFDPESTIDLPVPEEAPDGSPRPPEPAAGARPALPPASRGRRPDPTVVLLSVLGGVCMVSAVSSVLYLNHWNQAQQSLRQERNLLLVERLRELGPANPPPAAPAPPQLMAPAPMALQAPGRPGSLGGEDLPPPPEEPWIEELSELPQPQRPAAPILRVPLSPRLAAASAPAATAPASAPAAASAPPRAVAAPTPVLVGVVGAAGRAGSAIFQVGSISTSVGAGEAIGTSGWKLRSLGADMAEIERGGEVRRLSITNGF